MKKTWLLLTLPALALVSCGKRSFNAKIGVFSGTTDICVYTALENSEAKYYTLVSFNFVADDKGKDATKDVFYAKDKSGNKIDCLALSESPNLKTHTWYFDKIDKFTIKGIDDPGTLPSVCAVFDKEKVKEENIDDYLFYIGGTEVNKNNYVKVSF